MEPWQMNPSIRYMDRRTCSLSYKSPVLAYDYRLFAVCDGSCRLLIDGQTLVLNKDSLAIFPPATPYRFLFEESAPAVLYDINFSLGFQPGARHALAPVPQALFDPAKMPEQPDPVLFAQPLLLTGADELRRLDDHSAGYRHLQRTAGPGGSGAGAHHRHRGRRGGGHGL